MTTRVRGCPQRLWAPQEGRGGEGRAHLPTPTEEQNWSPWNPPAGARRGRCLHRIFCFHPLFVFMPLSLHLSGSFVFKHCRFLRSSREALSF